MFRHCGIGWTFNNAELFLPAHSISDAMCRLCEEVKLAITSYPDQNKLLNERSEVMSSYKHARKYILGVYELG